METTQAIQLKQKPIIVFDKIADEGNKVTIRLKELNLDKMVATTETVASLKKTRAELNSEAKVYEDLRKQIKAEVMAPYTQFEEAFKEHIITKYKDADVKLKGKIATVEDQVKTDRDKEIKDFFTESCEAANIDFLTYERARPNITLTASMKKLREHVATQVQNVANDLSVIETQEHKIEIMAEYKMSFNLTESIRKVNDRKQLEAQERERRNQAMIASRTNSLVALAMVYHDATKSYHWVSDESIKVSLVQVEELTELEWSALLTEVKSSIEASKPQPVPEEKPQPGIVENAPTVTAQQPQAEKAPVLQAPNTVVEEKEVSATFTVTATLPKLKALKQFLITNNIKFQ